MKRIFNVLFVALLAIAFQACDQKDDVKEEAVAVILKDGSTDYVKQLIASIEEECENNGVEALIMTGKSEYDVQSQIAAVESLSGSRYDIKGVVYMPIYAEGSGNGADDVIYNFSKSENVPVVFLDTKPSPTSPLKDSYKSFVGTDVKEAGEAFASIIVTESDPSKILSILYGTSATMQRYNIFKEAKQIKDDSNAIIVTDENGLTVSALNAKLASIPAGGSVAVFNGNFYDEILSFGDSVKGLSDKKIFAFDVYKSLLQSIVNGGNVVSIQAQNSLEMGRQAVKCIFTSSAKEVTIPVIDINSSNLTSPEVKPFVDYFGL